MSEARHVSHLPRMVDSEFFFQSGDCLVGQSAIYSECIQYRNIIYFVDSNLVTPQISLYAPSLRSSCNYGGLQCTDLAVYFKLEDDTTQHHQCPCKYTSAPNMHVIYPYVSRPTVPRKQMQYGS